MYYNSELENMPKKFNIKNRIIIITLSAVIVILALSFLAYEYYDFYVPQKFILCYTEKAGKKYDKKIHSSNCSIVKNSNSIDGSKDCDLISQYLQGEYEFCPLCNPGFSLKPIIEFKDNINREYLQLKSSEELDIENLAKAQSAKKALLENPEYLREKQIAKDKNNASGWLEILKHKYKTEGDVYEEFYNVELSKLGISQADTARAIQHKERLTEITNILLPKINEYTNSRKNIFLYLGKIKRGD